MVRLFPSTPTRESKARTPRACHGVSRLVLAPESLLCPSPLSGTPAWTGAAVTVLCAPCAGLPGQPASQRMGVSTH